MVMIRNLEQMVRNQGLWVDEKFKPYFNNDPKKILIYSPVPWHQGNLERMISVALRLRGHEVKEIICDGKFPACGMEHADNKRPKCKACIKNAKAIMNSWGLNYFSTDDFTKRGCYKRAKKEAKKINLSNFCSINYFEASEIKYKNFPIGKRIYEQIHWYFSEDMRNKKLVFDYAKKCIITYIMQLEITENIVNVFSPDILIVCDGKTIESSSIMDLALSKKIRCILWEERGANSFIFDINYPTIDYVHKGVWDKISKETLTKEQEDKVSNYFYALKKSLMIPSVVTTVKLYSNPIENVMTINSMLDLRENSYKVVLFCNLIRDVSIIGIDNVFSSIKGWIEFCAEYAYKNPDVDIILRAHPAENKLVGFEKPRIFVSDFVREQFRKIPKNMKLIEAGSQISSYALLELADICMAYTSTLVLEAPTYGHLISMVGNNHFYGKGFTHDIDSIEELIAILNSRQKVNVANDLHKASALKYAYFYFFRLMPNLDFYSNRTFTFDNLDFLLPGRHVFLDNLCDSIINDKAFIDLDIRARVPIDLSSN